MSLLSVHVAAGAFAMILGAIALSVKKGGTTHRRSGLLFVSAMLVMGATASALGLRISPMNGNVVTTGPMRTLPFVLLFGTMCLLALEASPPAPGAGRRAARGDGGYSALSAMTGSTREARSAGR
jgi:hypothetical protein